MPKSAGKRQRRGSRNKREKESRGFRSDKMKIFLITCSLLLLSTNAATNNRGYNFNKLAHAIDSDSCCPIWKVNENKTGKGYGYQLIFNENAADEIQIANFDSVLDGKDYLLLACYGKINPPENDGYVIGTANPPPTSGKILVYDCGFHKITEIESQKVVKITLINLLGSDVREIVSWEDHRYGTATTRRVLNIYQVRSDKKIRKIFEHDVVDARLLPGGSCDDKESCYEIDFRSFVKQKKIVVVNKDSGEKETYQWDGQCYRDETSRKRCPVGP